MGEPDVWQKSFILRRHSLQVLMKLQGLLWSLADHGGLATRFLLSAAFLEEVVTDLTREKGLSYLKFSLLLTVVGGHLFHRLGGFYHFVIFVILNNGGQ